MTVRNTRIDPALVKSTPCDFDHACLKGDFGCRVEPFLERELQLLRCMNDRTCAYKRQYRGQAICGCPVNRATFGFD